MANVGELSLTFNDIRKRQNLDGSIATIVELMEQADPIMQEIKWQEGNELTGNKTTQRTSLPKAHVRMINKGVPAGKSTTRQIVDTCVTFEGHVDTDLKLLTLQNDPQAYRASEVKAMAAGMTQQIASMIFYGKKENGMEFDGLGARYGTYGGVLNDAAYQVINAGGTTEGKQTSAWLVGFGDNAVVGIYPKNSNAGLKIEDMGKVMLQDEEGYYFSGTRSILSFDAGLAVMDPRMVAAVRNIDMKTLNPSSITSAQSKAIIDKMIIAQRRIRNMMPGLNFAWYVSPSLMTIINLFYADKNNVYITRQDAGELPEFRVNGIRVLQEDSITDTEDVIAEKA